MAFNKRLWKGRQGTGLNKFSINGATPVPVINQPDSVTEQGDALSAGNLNDLEDRIYDAFDDIADGTQVVGKATADASGNVITTTYATKSELTSEATARANADSNLLSAIDSNSKRITNLETKAGDEIPVTYPSATYGMDGVPASVAPYGKVRELVGVSRAKNQLASRFASDYWEVYDGSVVSSSFSDGVITATITSVASANYRQAIRIKSSYRPSIISGHFYLICYDIYSSVTSNYRSEIIPSYTGMFSVTGGQWTSFQAVTSAPSDSPASGSLIYPHSILAVNDYYKCRDYILTDLNQYFGTSDLSFLGATDTDKLATIQTNYPELLIPSDHDTGTIVSTTYSALKSVGVNMLDNSVFDSTSNFPTFYNNYYYADVIQLKPYTEYNVRSFLTGTSQSGLYGILLCPYNGFGYSPATLYINNGASASQTITTGANGQIRIGVMQPTSYIEKIKGNYDIQICLNSLPDAIKTEYHHYITDSLPLPTPVTLRGILKVNNGNLVVDGDEYEPETGDIERNYGIVTIDGSDDEGWYKSSNVFISNGIDVSDALSTNWWSPSLAVSNLLSRGVCVDYNSYDSLPFALTMVSGKIRLHITECENMTEADFKDWLSDNNIQLQYKLATPTHDTPIAPVIDPFLKVEGGGSVDTEQTNDPTITSAMDIDYLGV